MGRVFGVISNPNRKDVLLFSSRSFIILDFTFKSVALFGLVFVYDGRNSIEVHFFG